MVKFCGGPIDGCEFRGSPVPQEIVIQMGHSIEMDIDTDSFVITEQPKQIHSYIYRDEFLDDDEGLTSWYEHQP